MTDISKLFDDALYPVELKHPVTGDALGITFWIAPFAADAASDWWVRTNTMMANVKARAKNEEVDADTVAEIDAQSLIKRAIAAVRKWDWGDKSFQKINAKSPCNADNKAAVLNDPGASWIVAQIIDAGSNIENFTKAPVQD